MITSQDAKYILSEIRFMPYFAARVEALNGEISGVRQRIAEATSPRCPNGGIDIGNYPNVIRIKVGGTGGDAEKLIATLITNESRLITDRSKIADRWQTANGWRKKLESTQDGAFCHDFLTGAKSYSALEREYAVSNAYDRMIRIIRNTITEMRG